MQRVQLGWMARRRSVAAAAAAIAVIAAAVLTLPTDATVEPAAPIDPPARSDPTVRHDETGTVGFIGSAPGRPIETGATRADAPAAVARAFLEERGRRLGLTGAASGLRVADQRPLPGGGTVVRLSQTVDGVPVLGGEFTVNLDSGRDVLSMLGEASPVGTASAQPSVGASAARDAAVRRVARETRTPAARLTSSTPELMFYDPRLLDAPSPFRSARLSWVLEVRSRGPVAALRHQVVVDAVSGTVALSFSTIAEAKDRIVCDADDTSAGYPCTTPLRTETNPPAPGDDDDVRAAFDYAGDTYDFFFSRFGRDSLDGEAMPVKSTVDWCPNTTDCPYQNAFWDGSQMVYGDGFASADDVVGHELSHGVTDFTSRLFYYQQSGAINESMSDVFGEFVDLVNGDGTDTAAVRWQVGEDIPGFGAIRDMAEPPRLGQPDRMLSTLYDADPSEGDGGGVHINSGVANKAAYLMTNGGSFNGQTVTGLGITKAARIFHTANTTMLVSGSDYADLANSLRQGCRNLASTGTDGITTADCDSVDKAVLATEMDQNPAAAPTSQATVCPSGTTVASTVLADDLETNSGQFTFGGTTPHRWFYPQNPNPVLDATYATSGVTNAWGYDRPTVSDSWIRTTDPVSVPANAYLQFAHAYGFDDDPAGAWDGGVVEYSTSGPSGTWQDAGPLFAGPGGANGYTGVISSGYGNPLSGRSAFVRDSNGYGSSRADLTSLAGKSALFRWRIGTDSSVDDYGWFLDDLRISTCAAPTESPSSPAPTTTSSPAPTTTSSPAPTTTSSPAPTTTSTASPPSAPPPTFTSTSTSTPLPTTAPDTSAPQTSITKKPRKVTTRRSARFRFVADEAGVRFRCKLDRKAWRSCTSPTTFRVLVGRHTFRVSAIDAAGNLDSTPAAYRWRVRR